jgi:hypothetical protein
LTVVLIWDATELLCLGFINAATVVAPEWQAVVQWRVWGEGGVQDGLPAGGTAVGHYTALVLQYVARSLWQRS